MYIDLEIKRKLLHLSSLWIPLSVYLYGKNTMLWIFVLAAILLVIGEILRQKHFLYHRQINHLLRRTKITMIMRPHEQAGRFSGATYMLIAAVFCLLYSSVAFVLGFFILITADSAAALIGRKYGSYKIMDKSLQGSIAFFLVAFFMYWIVAFVLYNLPITAHIACVVAVICATLVELFAAKLGWDDNIMIPVSCGAAYEIVLWCGNWLLH